MREDGFYWIRLLISWEIAYYSKSNNNWTIVGRMNRFNNSDFEEIDERQIKRDENNHNTNS